MRSRLPPAEYRRSLLRERALALLVVLRSKQASIIASTRARSCDCGGLAASRIAALVAATVAAVSFGYKAGKRVRRKVTGRTKTEIKAKFRDLRRDLDSGVRSNATYAVGDALAGERAERPVHRTKEFYRDTVKHSGSDSMRSNSGSSRVTESASL